MDSFPAAFIALGSNLGDRLAMMREATSRVSQVKGVVVEMGADVASLYETQAVGGPEGQAKYLNSAMRVRTRLEPMALMQALLDIERAMGRRREVRWENRIIDLDLLMYDQCVCDTPGLTLPHPRMHERRFVLEPLAEIAGGIVHPAIGRTIAEIAADLRGAAGQEVVRIMGPEWTALATERSWS